MSISSISIAEDAISTALVDATYYNAVLSILRPVSIQLSTVSTVIRPLPSISITTNSYTTLVSIVPFITLTLRSENLYNTNILCNAITINAKITASNTFTSSISIKPVISSNINVTNAYTAWISLNRVISGNIATVGSYTLTSTILRPSIIINSNLISTVTKQTWAFNTITTAHSRYTNYNFDSYFKIGTKNYGIGSDGNIYEFGYNKDNDLSSSAKNINAEIILPQSSFNEQSMKSVSDAMILARLDGDMEVALIIDEQQEREGYYIRYDERSGNHRKRVKLPKGMKGNVWQFKLRNVDGSNFSINYFEIFVKTLQRMY